MNNVTGRKLLRNLRKNPEMALNLPIHSSGHSPGTPPWGSFICPPGRPLPWPVQRASLNTGRGFGTHRFRVLQPVQNQI